MNKSEQLIACLEGELAKRDARIVELESDLAGTQSRVLSLQDQWRKLDAELAEIKAQEPVAWGHTKQIKWLPAEPSVTCSVWNRSGATPSIASFRAPLYAAPVAKQVVMPERATADNTCADPKWMYGWNSCLDQFARLNAADQGGGV